MADSADSRSPGELAPGDRLAEFVVEDVAGRGAMGVVYRARQESLGRVVALKVIGGAGAADPAFRSRFTREARAAAALDHPHIVGVHGAGEADGVAWIAMPWVDGEDLREHLRDNGPLTPADAARIVGQIADALDTAHRAGILHRDVKPANIMLRQLAGGLHAYLTDFGVVRALADAGTVSADLTATGHVVGTPGFVAPEQVHGRPLDGRADLYALGCVLYETLTGEPPLRRESAMATLLAHASAPRPAVSEARPALGTAFDPVIARALAIDPDDRYPTGAALAAAVADAAVGGAPATSPTPGGEPPHPVGRSSLIGTEGDAEEPPTLVARARPRPPATSRTTAAPPASVATAAPPAARRRGRWPLLAAGVAPAVAAALVAAIVLTRGGDDPGAGTTPSTTTGTTTRARTTTGTATTGTAPATASTQALPPPPPATTTPPADPSAAPAAASVVAEYARAFDDHDIDAMRAVLAPGLVRVGGNGRVRGCYTTTGRDAALANYRGQFATVRSYALLGATAARVKVAADSRTATLSASSRITTTEPLKPQSIRFVLAHTGGRWLITEIRAKCAPA